MSSRRNFLRAPNFNNVDDPGGWPECCHRPEHQTAKNMINCVCHKLPTGVTPVPENTEGKQIHEKWEFFHNGWNGEGDDVSRRSGATAERLIPKEQSDRLHRRLSKQLGCNNTYEIHHVVRVLIRRI